MIREETLRYARSKNNYFFDIVEKDIMNFLGILINSGYHTIPSEKRNWSTRPSLVAPIYPETMSRSRFLEIKKCLHLSNNKNLSNSITAKVDPLYHKLLLNCQQFGIFHKKLSIDESMVSYRRKHPIKQFIRNKPVRIGYKIWFMCSTDGYLYNFQIYKGKETGPKFEALGPSVVEDIVSVIRHEDADKYFLILTTFTQGSNYLTTLTTIRNNRMMKCLLNILKKKNERVSLDYRSDGNVLFAQWKDNSVVSIGTNFSSITPLKNVNCWVKGAGKVAVDQPNLIADYNTCMGGVVLPDMR